MNSPDKKTLSEHDICTKFITPAVEKAGWDVLLQVREEVYFTKGRIIVRGNPKFFRMQHMLNKLAPISTASFERADSYMRANKPSEGKSHLHQLGWSLARKSQMTFKAKLV